MKSLDEAKKVQDARPDEGFMVPDQATQQIRAIFKVLNLNYAKIVDPLEKAKFSFTLAVLGTMKMAELTGQSSIRCNARVYDQILALIDPVSVVEHPDVDLDYIDGTLEDEE